MKSINEKTVAVEAIASALAALKPDEVLPYSQLDNLMLNDRNLLYRAWRIVEKSHGYIFSCVRGEGVKRLSKHVVIIDAAVVKTNKLLDATESRVVNAIIKDGGSMDRREKAELNSRIAGLNAIQLAARIARGQGCEIKTGKLK